LDGRFAVIEDKTAADFLNSLEVMRVALAAFHQGRRPLYLPLATELRKLLCDGKSTLLPRVFEEVLLHKLASTEASERDPEMFRKLMIFSSSVLTSTSTVMRADLDLAESGARLPLDEWLKQPYLKPGITLRDFIRSVSDKEAAHSDLAANATLSIAGPGARGFEIVAIAEYVFGFVHTPGLRIRTGVDLKLTPVPAT
jgi:hypothetical protein